MKRVFLINAILFGTVGCDQATKHIARGVLEGQAPHSFLGDFVRFQHAENPGAFLSFGAGLDDSLRFWIFTAFVIGFLLWAAIHLFRSDRMPLTHTVGWALVVAGGIGNVIDRSIRGTVTDFVMVGIAPLRTGIFNVADMAIMAGIACLLIWSRTPEREPNPTPGN